MADALYPKWKEQLLQNNSPAGTVTATVTDTSTDQFWPSAYAAPAWAKMKCVFGAAGSSAEDPVLHIDTAPAGASPLYSPARQPLPFD